MSTPLRADALPAPWCRDPFVRAQQRTWRDCEITSSPLALCIIGRRRGAPGLLGLGEPTAVAGLLARTRPGVLVGVARATLSRAAWPVLPPGVAGVLDSAPRSEWDWYDTAQLPPVPSGTRVVELTSDDLPQAVRLQQQVLPDASLPVGEAGARWFGCFDDDGRLRALGGAAGWSAQVQLGSIVTDPAWQGRGLGAAVTAHLTREAVRVTGSAGLGVHAANVAAARLYRRLGYRLRHELTSTRPVR